MYRLSTFILNNFFLLMLGFNPTIFLFSFPIKPSILIPSFPCVFCFKFPVYILRTPCLLTKREYEI